MHPTDHLLWEQIRDGSQAAFGVVFDRHVKSVYNHCFRLAASWTGAEDATQKTFLIAWRKRDDVRFAGGSALPWLLSVATNVVREERRSARRWLAALSRAAPDPVAGGDLAEDVAERVDAERRMRRVSAAVRRLPRGEREVLALCVWSGVSYVDAAALLGITEGSVRARISRARSRLSRLLEPPPANGSADEDAPSGGRDD